MIKIEGIGSGTVIHRITSITAYRSEGLFWGHVLQAPWHCYEIFDGYSLGYTGKERICTMETKLIVSPRT